MIRSIVSLVIGVVMVLGGVGAVRAEDVRASIEANNQAFIRAFLKGDASAVAALYTPDAKVFAPGAPVANGRTAIAALWQTQIDSHYRDVQLTTASVESAGDLAYEDGAGKLIASDGKVTEFRYVVVWKRVADQWLLHRDIWN